MGNLSLQGLPAETIQVGPSARKVIPIELVSKKLEGLKLKDVIATINVDLELLDPSLSQPLKFASRYRIGLEEAAVE
jgi:hypothetical protein